MSPLISIVVPTLNQAAFIEQTLASIVGQNWPRLELIVIDGGSTDGTREIVERYPVKHFISERDSGQAEAINKGMRLATGDVLAWLNSDDYYLPLTFARALDALGETSVPRFVYGNCILWYEEEQRALVERSRPFDREVLRRCTYLIQPSSFWTRALWEKTGPLNQDLHFVLDWDWFFRASAHCEFKYVNQTLSVYRFHGGHKSSSGSPRRRQEIIRFVEEHASPEWAAAFHAVDARLPRLRTARFRPLRFPGLYLRHGKKTDVAFWQLGG